MTDDAIAAGSEDSFWLPFLARKGRHRACVPFKPFSLLLGTHSINAAVRRQVVVDHIGLTFVVVARILCIVKVGGVLAEATGHLSEAVF